MKPAARHEVMQHIERLAARGSLHGMSPGEWLERFLRTRDEDAFAALVDTYGPMVLGVCRSLLRHSHDADDAFQATFLLLVRKGPQIRDRSRLGTWLHRVACRVARRAGRQRDALGKRFVAVDESHEPIMLHVEPEAQVATAESLRLLHEAIDSLPGAQRDALILCDLEGLSHADAAARLRWPLGTVKGRLARARRKLHGRLVRQGVTLSVAGAAGLLAATTRASVAPALREATVSAASGLVARQSLASLLPSSTASLVTGESTSMFMIIGKYAAVSIVSAVLVAGGALALRQDATKQEAVEPSVRASASGVQVKSSGDQAKLGGELADLELELQVLQSRVIGLQNAYIRKSEELRTWQNLLKRDMPEPTDKELEDATEDAHKKLASHRERVQSLRDKISQLERELATTRAKHRDLAEQQAAVLARINNIRAQVNQAVTGASATTSNNPKAEVSQPSTTGSAPPRQTATIGEIKINAAPGTAGITEQERGALRIERDNVAIDLATAEARVDRLREDLKIMIGWMLGTERDRQLLDSNPRAYLKSRGIGFTNPNQPGELKSQFDDDLESAKKEVASLRDQYDKANRELQTLRQKLAELQDKLAAPEAAPRNIRPGDTLQIGVLTALPGRPLDGQRLVRPDGTVSLGYYGDLHVAGLDRMQIKVKLIEHMRQYLGDEALGLVTQDEQGRQRPVSPAQSDTVMVDESPSLTENDAARLGTDEAPRSPLGQIPISGGGMGGGFR